ncbi:hypothetical protein [Coprobacter tertius]|uniref:DUF4842 domain-containing protein n=1 Tax=Coprobacter tertius TaxID=2944915 RepID=A0ABT1MHS3_9BACT|nr:hypothetical protein [Coprobacter tertius]MCP9612155.1 hypothetical protein [Coprobacter tertius]
MKKAAFFSLLILTMNSCINSPEVSEKTIKPEKFINTEPYSVNVKSDYVTKVSINGVLLAEVITPTSIMIPKGTQPTEEYIPKSEYPNMITENKSKLYQVVCFEDSRSGDYDYNDLVIHVKYQRQGNIFGFGVQPIALGSTKDIRLGCTVYCGNTQIFDGLLSENTVRVQLFKGIDGIINTFDPQIKPVEQIHKYFLGSTIRNWDISKFGSGIPNVEWYILVDGNTKLYALSTSHLNQSFNKEGIPYGIVITCTGVSYTDKGLECGFDWFNYPKETVHIKDVYPDIWKWLSTDATFDFSDFYSKDNIPENALAASDLGLFISDEVNVCDSKFRVE